MLWWDDHNPWADTVVYLPDLKELSACLDPHDPERNYNRWVNEHDLRLDAYILPQPSGVHDCGVRYGDRPEEYYSPYINHYIATLLLSKYQKPERSNRYQFYKCQCGNYHSLKWHGDCNDLAAQYTPEFLNKLYGHGGWDVMGSPMQEIL